MIYMRSSIYLFSITIPLGNACIWLFRVFFYRHVRRRDDTRPRSTKLEQSQGAVILPLFSHYKIKDVVAILASRELPTMFVRDSINCGA